MTRYKNEDKGVNKEMSIINDMVPNATHHNVTQFQFLINTQLGFTEIQKFKHTNFACERKPGLLNRVAYC